MPMGIVSDKEFDLELERNKIREKSNSIPINKPEVIDINKGRGNGNIQVPESLRKVIGETSITDGRREALQLGQSFGISASSVSAYANGSTSTASYDERPNVDVINQAKEKISKKARGKLFLALSKITSEKLDETKPRDLAGIAKDMSAIVKDMEPETKADKGNGGNVNFVFFAPQMRSEDSYEKIHVKE